MVLQLQERRRKQEKKIPREVFLHQNQFLYLFEHTVKTIINELKWDEVWGVTNPGAKWNWERKLIILKTHFGKSNSQGQIPCCPAYAAKRHPQQGAFFVNRFKRGDWAKEVQAPSPLHYKWQIKDPQREDDPDIWANPAFNFIFNLRREKNVMRCIHLKKYPGFIPQGIFMMNLEEQMGIVKREALTAVKIRTWQTKAGTTDLPCGLESLELNLPHQLY